MPSVEDALRFFASVQSRPNISDLWPKLFGRRRPFPSQIFEFRGQSKRAISVILMEVFARIAFPPSVNPYTSGRDGSILYINCDGNPITDLFRDYLHKVVSRYLNDSESVDAIVAYTLDNLIVIDPNNMQQNSPSSLKFEDLIVDKEDICLIVIDSIDGYNPESTGQPVNKEETATYFDKVSYLKLILEDIKVVTIYLRRDCSNLIPPKGLFIDIDIVFICNDFGPSDGVIVHQCDKEKQLEKIFNDVVALHDM